MKKGMEGKLTPFLRCSCSSKRHDRPMPV